MITLTPSLFLQGYVFLFNMSDIPKLLHLLFCFIDIHFQLEF